MTEFPVLQTKRLTLNEIQSSDCEPVFAIYGNPDVVAHYDVEQFTQPSEAEQLIRYFRSHFRTQTGIRWAIRQRPDGEFMGSCGFSSWNQYDGSIVLGYDLAPVHWGQGYALEAVRHIVSFAFSDSFPFRVNRIESIIMPGNKASIALSEKLGFQFEGCLREKCYVRKQHHDMNLYSLLRREHPLD